MQNQSLFVQLLATHNPLVNRTRNGMPRLGLISFWPKRVIPLRAGYRERVRSCEIQTRGG